MSTSHVLIIQKVIRKKILAELPSYAIVSSETKC